MRPKDGSTGGEQWHAFLARPPGPAAWAKLALVLPVALAFGVAYLLEGRYAAGLPLLVISLTLGIVGAWALRRR